MKTKLLKKLRTEAHQLYGVKGYLELSGGGGVYVVGMRELTSKKDVAEYTLKSAKKKLAAMRNEYCKSRVEEMRINNRINRFCKL